MGRWTLEQVASACRKGWSAETCDPVDLPKWSEANRARGQCGVTALVVHDLLGGEVLLAEVLLPDGTRQGVHYWNRLANGDEVDLTVGQFTEGEQIQQGRIVSRPSGPARRCHEQYSLLRQRVLERLGVGE